MKYPKLKVLDTLLIVDTISAMKSLAEYYRGENELHTNECPLCECKAIRVCGECPWEVLEAETESHYCCSVAALRHKRNNPEACRARAAELNSWVAIYEDELKQREVALATA